MITLIILCLTDAALVEIRRHRVRAIAPRGVMGDVDEAGNAYIDPETVREEVVWARRLCTRNGWPVVDVSHRFIEETSAAVIELGELWQSRRHRDPARLDRASR